MRKVRRKDQDGKPSENRFKTHMENMVQQDRNWWYHRFPDASVTKKGMGKRPSDFIVCYQAAASLVEVKAVDKGRSLPISRLTQRPKMRLFERAGGKGFFLVHLKEFSTWHLITLESTLSLVRGSIKMDPEGDISTLQEVTNAIRDSIKHVGSIKQYKRDEREERPAEGFW